MFRSDFLCSASLHVRTAVERIDILESKLKDLQDELEWLRGNKNSVGTTGFLHVESEAWVDSKLRWKEVKAEAFVLNEDKTSIKVLVPGLYSIGLVVNHVPVTNGIQGLVSLQVNGETTQSAATGTAHCRRSGGFNSHQIGSSLMYVAQVENEASPCVLCANTSAIPNTPSYLTVARIGD
ncbi:hypothetical protein P3T76_006060 [Phytophthora citrophthora]|uniref:Uncharacterized protein n=1 Tax=Phytophthora citrophthora TaxID=4793 RepID=A0AAD9LNM2_9STRA|nr:hypothetical protein P3T76_006060 [Phytophthora citrophthora]